MQNPARRSLGAVAALLALSITLAACTGSTKVVPHTIVKTTTVTVTRSVPNPSSSGRTGILLDPSSSLSKAETNFQKASIATGLKIAEDAANPNSLTEAYDGTSVGNKRLELANGLDKKAGFPEIFLDYLRKSRQVTMWSITSTNPTARLSKMRFKGIALTFQSLDPKPNNLDQKIAKGQQLTAADYAAFFRGSLGMRVAQITHGNAKQTTITLHGMVYEYHAATASNYVPITASNYGTMERMGRSPRSSYATGCEK